MIIGGAVVLVILVLVGIFTGIIPGARQSVQKLPAIKLMVWGTEDRSFFEQNFQAYQNLRTNVQISYKKINEADYENELINAMAAGNGPDVFMFHNTWLPKHYDKIVPASDSQITLAQLNDFFPRVVAQDFAPDNVIFALPLYIDTLALYYNQDIFDSMGIALMPDSWDKFQGLIPRLRQIDKTGQITRAAAAIGGSLKSVDVATDLLSLLMLQNNVKMTDDNFTYASFADRRYAGLDVFNFYIKFSDPGNIYYTWNDGLNSVDSFAQGKTAMIFDYDGKKADIKKANPFLNFGIIPAPQITPGTGERSYANYWGLAVSNKSKYQDWAWDLIVYLTTNETQAVNYLSNSGHPPALKILIDKYSNDPEFGVFAKQALTARSWPQIDNNAVKSAFSVMIEAVINRRLDADTALNQAQSVITNLMQKKR
ncbi:MAG: multiple sugar transport system substrate-binding protein [Parcubacteria group bacterium Athens0714_26]|nr:MAG: multiple sugar transport system substrate-binding protein [Parcubacteria group bacterium Athens1014_26]TSD03706.1 MAG: multiple sugar transport system substrate-binding protein [Parcubacteria group bacterium Athens0714_26]